MGLFRDDELHVKIDCWMHDMRVAIVSLTEEVRVMNEELKTANRFFNGEFDAIRKMISFYNAEHSDLEMRVHNKINDNINTIRAEHKGHVDNTTKWCVDRVKEAEDRARILNDNISKNLNEIRNTIHQHVKPAVIKRKDVEAFMSGINARMEKFEKKMAPLLALVPKKEKAAKKKKATGYQPTTLAEIPPNIIQAATRKKKGMI